MLIVCAVAQSPEVGVNVQVLVERLFSSGDQDPLTPLVELVGKGSKVEPEHIAAT